MDRGPSSVWIGVRDQGSSSAWTVTNHQGLVVYGLL